MKMAPKRGGGATGNSHQPGDGYKRNFNRGASGKFHISMKRGVSSRSKSRGSR